jgi:hypothetical protein
MTVFQRIPITHHLLCILEPLLCVLKTFASVQLEANSIIITINEYKYIFTHVIRLPLDTSIDSIWMVQYINNQTQEENRYELYSSFRSLCVNFAEMMSHTKMYLKMIPSAKRCMH